MTTANADYNPHDLIGARVVITGGAFIGEEGVVENYTLSHDVFLVILDSGIAIYTFNGMFDVLDEEDYEGEAPEGMPDVPLHGMTSEQLADYVSDFIVACTTRVKGVGDEQYSQGDSQKFEGMSLDDLLQWAEEEVQDLAVYAAMLHIRLARIRNSALKDLL